MSNVIKASAVRYTENKRVIDMNEKSERIKLLYEELLNNKDGKSSAPKGFVEGLKYEKIDVDDNNAELAGNAEKLNDVSDTGISTDIEEQLFGDFNEHKRKAEEETKAILNSAKEEVKNMLDTAKKEADAIKDTAYEKAQKEGYAAGIEQAKEEYEQKIAELEAAKEELRREREAEKKQLEPDVVDIICAIVKKLTGVLIDEKKEIIEYLVEQSLLNLEHSDSYLIRVSKADYDTIAARKPELIWKIKEGADIEIIEDPVLSKAQCLIETDSRIIDCSLDVQLKNLIIDLKLLAGSANDNS